MILEQDRKVPEYCWNTGICKDVCEARTGVIPGTFSVDLLSDMEFLVYRLPKTRRGMSGYDTACYSDFIAGSYLWAGSPADVYVMQWTTQQARRDKAKTREYRWKITVERLAVTQVRLQDLDLVAQKNKERALNLVGRGRGMICRADKFLAQQHGREPERIPGPAPGLPVFLDRAATPDDYHSALEPSEFEYDSEETDPEGLEHDTEEDDGSASLGSDSTYKLSDRDTDRTRSTTAHRNQRRNQQKQKEGRGWHPTNTKKEDDKHKGKVVLSLFRDSPKEGALTYTDWRREVEEYIQKGYDDNRIKDAMLSSVEGQAYVNFCSCDEGRNRTPEQILKEMDSIYNVSVKFRDLNARMCGLKQGPHEPIKTYYKRMADISVKLEQYHGDCFGPGKLRNMKKDCFYAGLKEHNKYLVSHMKDRDQYGLAQMLKEIREQEDSRYLANTTPKPHNHDNPTKAPAHYGGKGAPYDKHRTYVVRHTDVQLPEAEENAPEPSPPPSCDINPNDIYDEGYYVAVINMANEAELWGCCFNCGKEGHHWADCTELLKESLKQAKERANCKKQALNRGGGAGAKGVWPPRQVRPWLTRPKAKTSRP